MKAFHDDPKVKKKYLRRINEHFLADEIVKGIYWEDGKGCAVGCTIHSNKHSAYEIKLGIPTWLAYLEDRIFEGLPNEQAKSWPQEFLGAVQIGSDLGQIKDPFFIFVIEFAFDQFDHEKFPDCKIAIEDVIAFRKLSQELRTVEKTHHVYAAAFIYATVAKKNAYIKFADKLLELIRDCK